MCLTFAAERPQISTFRRRNPLELETPKTAGVKSASDGVPFEHSRKFGADRAPGRQILVESALTLLGSETGFVRAFDLAKHIGHPLSTANVIAPCHRTVASADIRYA